MYSRLLITEEPIVINRLAANVLGFNEAALVQQLHYWININEKAKINYYDNRTWTFNSYEKWHSENFSFWSISTLKRLFDSLHKKGVLIKGNYNRKKYDRTLWVTINYEKLDELLAEYELKEAKSQENVEVSTEYQNDTMSNCNVLSEDSIASVKNDINISKSTTNVEISTKYQNELMSDTNIVSKWDNALSQNDTMDNVKLTLPIPETTKEITKEISITTCSTKNQSVVKTNKELIEEKTHLLIDSSNKKNKVIKWNKERLIKSIDIFIENEGTYFSLLEKIYKDDKNFTNYKTSYKKVKTRFHNIDQRTDKYTDKELEALILRNQILRNQKKKSTETVKIAPKKKEKEIKEEGPLFTPRFERAK